MIHLNQFFSRTKHIALYALFLAILAFGLKWLQWKYLVVENSLGIYITLIAILFTVLGVWVASHLIKPATKTVIVEKEIYIEAAAPATINHTELNNLNLTPREHEVLQLLVKGYSNAEIAKELFLSLSTIKTHVSNVLAKMDVKSRAQAIEKAKRLKITA